MNMESMHIINKLLQNSEKEKNLKSIQRGKKCKLLLRKKIRMTADLETMQGRTQWSNI